MKSYLQTILIAISVADATATYILVSPKSPAYSEILIKGSIMSDEFEI